MLFHLINSGNVKRELWFKINDVKVCFSPLEFAVVTGPILGLDMDVSAYVDCSRRPYLK